MLCTAAAAALDSRRHSVVHLSFIGQDQLLDLADALLKGINSTRTSLVEIIARFRKDKTALATGEREYVREDLRDKKMVPSFFWHRQEPA
jgi:hypothetical protein